MTIYRGGDENNRITGQGENDTFYGRGGTDWVIGQGGDDRIFGGTGDDDASAFGELQDPFERYPGLHGGDGNDTIFGGENDQNVRSGNDFLFGENGHDTLYGEDGNDLLMGEYFVPSNTYAGNDTLYGGDGRDDLRGGNGRDTFVGGSGVDRMFDDDVVNGAPTVDYNDADTFVFNEEQRLGNDYDSGVGAGNRDIIYGFDRNLDRIDLSSIDANRQLAGNQAFDFRDVADGRPARGEIAIIQSGGDTIIRANTDGDTVLAFEIELDSIVTTTIDELDFIL